VSEHGRTVLFVSHNMTNVRALCSRVILIDKGMIVMDDVPGRMSAALEATCPPPMRMRATL